MPQEVAYPASCNQLCEPGTQRACYTGAAGTENVGICKGGFETCQPDGLGYGACEGEVVPALDICANSIDEDCDGILDNTGDLDGDGYAACADGDCCELGEDCGADPADVNPGAFEVVANGVDDGITCGRGASVRLRHAVALGRPLGRSLPGGGL